MHTRKMQAVLTAPDLPYGAGCACLTRCLACQQACSPHRTVGPSYVAVAQQDIRVSFFSTAWRAGHTAAASAVASTTGSVRYLRLLFWGPRP